MRITVAKCLFLYEIILVGYLLLFSAPRFELLALFDMRSWTSMEIMGFLNIMATSLVFWVLIFRNEETSFFNRGFSIDSRNAFNKKKKKVTAKKEKKKKTEKKKLDEEEEAVPSFPM